MTRKFVSPRLIAALLTAFAADASAQISYTGGVYTQDFDTLANTGTGTTNLFTDNVTLPGWYTQAIEMLYAGTGPLALNMAGETRTNADDYAAGAGEGTSGDLYSFGAAGSTERALGSLGSGTPDEIVYGFQIQNDTGLPIGKFTLTYDGEQWRRGANTVQRPESLLVYYRVGGTNFLDNTGWVEVPDLAFASPNATDATASALDGNLAENRRADISKEVLLGAPLANGESLWVIWVDPDNAGTDHGLAIDNVRFSAVTSTGSDVTRGAGNIFSPNSFGGNAFSADDNAVFAGSPASMTLNGQVTAASLKFTSTGHILSGGASDSLQVTGAISVTDEFSSVEISGVLAGTSGLTKIGAGRLLLSGANTYSGSISVIEGVLAVLNDASLGSAENDLTLAGGTLAAAGSSLSLGAGRTISGSGVISFANSSGALVVNGDLAVGNLTISGASAASFAGASNVVSTLIFSDPVAVGITGAPLAPTSGVVFNQTSGTSTINGALNVTAAGDRSFAVAGGSVRPTNTFGIGTGRYIKTGAGTLDLTSTTLTTGSPTAGGFRLGVQGANPAEGGTLIVDQVSDLGAAQLQFNSGILQATAPLDFPVGLSIGGRLGSLASAPTFNGSPVSFAGNSGFFAAGGASGDIALVVNTDVTLSGTVLRTTAPTAQQPIPPLNYIDLSGTGSLRFAGDASAVLDRFYVHDGAELVIDGVLGGERIQISSGAILSGGGTYNGYFLDSTVAGVIPYVASSLLIDADSTIAPSGVFTARASVTLDAGSHTRLDIDGATRGTQYDALQVEVPAASGFTDYALNLGGTLTLDFGGPAVNGDYSLISTGAGVARNGDFGAVFITGTYTLPLVKSGNVWSGSASGVSFALDATTGVLTVSGGVAQTTALEDWRFVNFGDTANSGQGADTADYDGDGIPNLVEYATGTDPKVANAPVVVAGRSGDFLTLSYPVIADASLVYSVAGSDDLALGFVTASGSTQVSGGVATYTDNVPLTSGGVRRFLRLVVSYGQN